MPRKPKAPKPQAAIPTPAELVPDGGFTVLSEQPAPFPFAHVVDGVVVETPPTGVRSPANIEIDLNVPVFASDPGIPIQPQVAVPATQAETARVERVPHTPAGVFGVVPTVPQSVQTRGPLVALDPVQPSTVEVAVRDQRIPNDQIGGVFEDANGVKRTALGHVLEPGGPPKVAVKPTGEGF